MKVICKLLPVCAVLRASAKSSHPIKSNPFRYMSALCVQNTNCVVSVSVCNIQEITDCSQLYSKDCD